MVIGGREVHASKLLLALVLLSFPAPDPGVSSDLSVRLWRDLRPGASGEVSSDPWQLSELAGAVWFSAWSGETGREAWVWSGTQAPQLLKDACPGECDGDPFVLGRAGGRLIFGARALDPAPAAPPVVALWSTLGTPATTVRLADAAPGGWFVAADPERVAHLPGGALLVAEQIDGVLELWRTDGTAEGTRWLAGFPSVQGLPPHIVLREQASGVLIFVDDRVTATGIWRTDGTSEGTVRAVRVPIFQATISTEAPYFLAGSSNEGGSGTELWSSQGTSGTTRRLLRVAQGDGGIFRDSLRQLGTRALFEVRAPEGPGVTWWISDGTASGTRPRAVETQEALLEAGSAFVDGALVYLGWRDAAIELRTLPFDGSGPSTLLETTCEPGYCFQGYGFPFLRRVADTLVYSGGASDSGQELRLRPAGAGSAQTIDLCPGACGSAPRVVAVAGDGLVVGALRESGSEELWRVALDGAVRPLTDFAADFGGADRPCYAEGFAPETALVVGGAVYFSAEVAAYGNELWRAPLDGSGVELAADLGSAAISSSPLLWGVAGGELFFKARDLVSGRPNLLRTTGSPEEIEVVPDTGCYPDSWWARTESAFFWSHHILFDGEVLCVADRDSIREFPDFEGWGMLPWHDRMLLNEWNGVWVTDGTEAGTEHLIDEPDFEVVFADARSFYFTEFGHRHWDLWHTDPTGGERTHLARLAETQSPGLILESWPLGERTFFSLALGEELVLWVTDGSVAGTSELARFARAFAEAGYPIDSGVELATFQGRAHWLARGLGAESWGAWSSDGTPGGTRELARLPADVALAPERPVATPLGIYFGVERGDGRKELWRTDGSEAGTYPVFSSPSSDYRVPGTPVFFHDRVVFAGWDPDSGAEPWETFGTPGSTRRIADLRPGSFGSAPVEFTPFDDRLFFAAEDREHGAELWVIDPPAAADCPAFDEIACTAGGRFRWFASWRDFQGGQGLAHRGLEDGDSALLWFFDPTNVELAVKALDGRSVNDHFWAFVASLSNVEFSVTLADAETGAGRTFLNPLGAFASQSDVEALPGDRAGSRPAPIARILAPSAAAPDPGGGDPDPSCRESASRLCLQQGRFAVEARWRDFAGRQGAATAFPLTADSGGFWFFAGDNFELVTKVLDGRGVNGRFWVFYGALSDVEYTLTVTDTWTGLSREYRNPLGRLASFGDVEAF